MDSEIAYFIVNKIYMRKEEFINNMCQRYYQHLFEYLDIYSCIYNKKNRFSFIEEDWHCKFVKNNFKNLHLGSEGKDYKIILHELEIENLENVEVKEFEVKLYNSKFIESCMTCKCKDAMCEINYIKNKYKEYVDEFKYMNM